MLNTVEGTAVRAEWISRSTESDPVHAALRHWLCVPMRRHLWVPADAVTFTPQLLSRVYGDGRALIGLTTINNRPRFYYIRIDSSWSIDMDRGAPPDAPELREFIDDICWALEDEFGSARPDSEEDDPDILKDDQNPWPAFDDRDGCSWWRVNWPPLLGRRFEPHPYGGWQANLIVVDA